ncbi:MAG: hypothetical protein J1F20_08800 [Muribaculaceae bacterium]|nr:hypothetical protein [Muribaculaceae bacterium]
MDHKLTEQLGQWLNSPDNERDYSVGALMLLKLSGNQIMYMNNIRCLDSRREFITRQLQKYFNFRIQKLTHEQVVAMDEQVEVIAKAYSLMDAPAVATSTDNKVTETSDTAEPKQLGKRPDHEDLPDEIKAKFIENLELLRRMRELHLRLRTLSLENATCPDSERYPFLKELIELDKKLHKNWEEYDHYVAPSPQANANATPKAAKKTTAKKAAKTTAKKK